MGRASRLPRALGEDNRGNVGRVVMAHGTCNQCLAHDLRIEAVYRDWVWAQEQHRRDGPPAWCRTPGDLHRVWTAIAEAEIDHIADCVLRPMAVPWRWCAEALVRAYFPTILHNERHPENRKVLRVSAGLPAGLPTGQAPPHNGAVIAENVRWWYRATVRKGPTDSIHTIAEEWAEREKRDNDCRSVVQDGIKRAELLLNRRIR